MIRYNTRLRDDVDEEELILVFLERLRRRGEFTDPILLRLLEIHAVASAELARATKSAAGQAAAEMDGNRTGNGNNVVDQEEDKVLERERFVVDDMERTGISVTDWQRQRLG